MVRTLPPIPSTLRNRNRIHNKSRLRIVFGNLDADSIIPDEDDERHRLEQSVLGVDQDDVNEHHLQAVLSEAALRSSRDIPGKKDAPVAYIPTPDSTGIVNNYAQLYPPNKWKSPALYKYSSCTPEEYCDDALANGFTYYMDERDNDWLQKNNEVARGEGTSVESAISAAAAAAALKGSNRSAKGKGKEQDIAPVVISEDEFELVMGLFEKATHEQTEFLHHSLETGMAFPSFVDYQDIFSSPLTPHAFALLQVPSWIPSPEHLTRIARAIYPHWKTRRLDRSGHRIIPTLNFDESDTLNESYVCFRRRELKAARKTRATQVATSDKLSRLHAEFGVPLQLVDLVISREGMKKGQTAAAEAIWLQRCNLVDLKRRNNALGERGDEGLFFDKESPVKRIEPLRPKALPKQEQFPPRPPENALRPRDRLTLIQNNTETLLSRLKERDHNWEDYLDCPYQSTAESFASRLFKFIPSSDAKSSGDSSRPVRLRYGRGGRLVVDRRQTPRTRIGLHRQRTASTHDPELEYLDEEAECNRRLLERWKYDIDDNPSTGPWAEEQDRVLVDDCDPKNIRWAMILLPEADHHYLNINPTLLVTGPDGQPHPVLPYRLGIQVPIPRGQPAGRFGPQGVAPLAMINGVQVSISQQMRIQPNQGRLAPNGVTRTPAVVASMQPAPSSTSLAPESPHHPTPDDERTSSLADGVKTVSHPVGAAPLPHKVDASAQQNDGNSRSIPLQEPVQPNGYHVLTNGYPNPMVVASNAYIHHLSQTSGLSAQQMQNLKSAFAMPVTQGNMAPFLNSSLPLPMTNVKIPPMGQMHWNGPLPSTMNGSLNLAHGVPRTFSNGSRVLPMPNGHIPSLSPQHSPSPIPLMTRPPATPAVTSLYQ